MFFAEPYSEAGRATHTQLNSLRRQLGLGVDPAYDYSAMEEAQQKLVKRIQAKKRGETSEKSKDDPLPVPVAPTAAPPSGLEQLRRALREVAGPGDEAGEPDDEGASPKGLRVSPTAGAQAADLKDRARASPAFLARGRDSLDRADHGAPPPGTYRPKDQWMRPKVPNITLAPAQSTKSLRRVQLEEEIDRLRAMKKPFDHLTKVGVSVESEEGIPGDKLKQHVQEIKIGKATGRPDMIKAAGITFNVNTFTDGVLEGHLLCSSSRRSPSWDIAKSSSAVPRQQDSYFQPGQYKINDSVIRPRTEKLNLSFEKQPSRKPLLNAPSAARDVPDRSLSRKSGKTQESKAKLVLDFKKYTRRPDEAMVIEYHDKNNPIIDNEVLTRDLTFDAIRAHRAIQTRSRPPESFDKALSRQQHAAAMRHSGPEVMKAQKDDPAKGSHSSPSLGAFQDSTSHAQISPRAHAASPPSRKRDFSHAARFERGVREGDRRSPVALSQLSNSIAYFRATRSYEALPRREYPADVQE
eukprot:CAMPEP_0178381066 /NCGR_PEP_ID=MMETSP0689_2-20121128/5790_1 /TAXON_ID=160604 /ORGANISM="Amphidinium massartii, Strain CS-259" /LENGTH=522 /DNA_ID=CAMNT_0020001235 /DNA_START=41 /DNA_END=1606 /DNA_ORIENTATION=-